MLFYGVNSLFVLLLYKILKYHCFMFHCKNMNLVHYKQVFGIYL